MPRRLAADGETLTERYGRFSAQPFERGFGTTVGNSLRRALLSSIEGAAITAVKIEGVEHEFSSIKGVVEDATDVILNLKQVPFKLHGNEPKTLTITKNGAGEVTAGDIEARRGRRDSRSDVAHRDPERGRLAEYRDAPEARPRLRFGRSQLRRRPLARLHPDRFGAHAGQEGELRGRCRASRAEHRVRQADIEVWTDGSVKPDDAIGLAAKLIKDHMAIFINFEEDTEDYSYPTRSARRCRATINSIARWTSWNCRCALTIV